MYGSGATCTSVNLFVSNFFSFRLCEMEVGTYLSVILDIGKGGLDIHLVRIEVVFEVAVSEYALDNKLGWHCCLV